MCQSYNKQYGTDYISAMPTNLYGPNDNFDLETSHVLPALIRKIHEAKINNEDVTIWGTGAPKREFLHVDDFADACVFLMNNYSDSEIINVGCGEDISILDLAELIGEVVGFKGEIIKDKIKVIDATLSNKKLQCKKTDLKLKDKKTQLHCTTDIKVSEVYKTILTVKLSYEHKNTYLGKVKIVKP